MKILVTGGSGFIGSHIVDQLVDQGISVRVMDLKKPHRDDVEFIEGDITVKRDIDQALKGSDVIYHIAACSNVDLVKHDPVRTVEVNIIGTAKLLNAAVKHDIKRFIFASSVFVYETRGHLYTTAKAASEMLCKDFNRLYGLPFTILRYGTAYGPRSRDADVISLFVKKALKKENLVIHGNGQQQRNFIYVEDLAEGSVRALRDKAESRVYRLMSPVSTSIRELAELVRGIICSKIAVVYTGGRHDDYQGQTCRYDDDISDFGWKPRVSLEEGIRRTAEWYKAQYSAMANRI